VIPNAVSAAVSSLDSFFDALQDEDVPQPWTTPGPVAQRPPRLLLTLLGDYWWQRTESLPSAAIVGLLAEFGVSDSAARAALSRLTRNGLLVTSRSGRRTFVRLSQHAADVLDDGGRRIFSFGEARAPWDGMWSLVAFSIPEDRRSERDELRKALRWLGFAPLYDGLWVCPRDHADAVMARLKDLGIGTATAFRATALPGVTADGAGRADLTDASAARDLFITCYDLLGPLAARRVRQIISRYSPELAGRAAYHSSQLTLSAADD
jgi:phenylacetic acid degradation operon negative regulatory protein